MEKVGDNTWVITQGPRRHYIGNVREVCAALLDTGSCSNVSLILLTGATISIDFESKREAEEFFEEIGNEIYRNQQYITRAADKQEKAIDNVVAS